LATGFHLSAPSLRIGMLIGLAVLNACSIGGSHLEQIRSRGQLRVVMLNQPTTYYLGAQGAEGYEYRLAKAFAKRLDVQLVVQPVRDINALRATLEAGDADLAASQLSADEGWKTVSLASNTYRRITQVVVQRRGARAVRDIAALRGLRLVVATDSPQQQLLAELRRSGDPSLTWTELSREQADPLDWVASNDADCAIVDETEFQFARFLKPDTVVAFKLPGTRAVQWMVRKDAPDLRAAVNAFFGDADRSGLLTQLDKETLAGLHEFEYLEAQRYQDDIANRLPALRPAFESAAVANGLDWRLIAAVAYQESKWHADATSGEGAAGIMMLTDTTATAVGVKDRLNAQDSIRGGATYLARVVQMFPERIPEPDRTWFALAAYNVGFGHLEDARILAQARGRDADSWDEVAKMLPLLAEERWYLQTKRGYARGWEPVDFVKQVRGFLAVLEWQGADAAGDGALAPVSITAQRKKVS
jgi:membrane-bound lytic murein transglycosylase F